MHDALLSVMEVVIHTTYMTIGDLVISGGMNDS